MKWKNLRAIKLVYVLMQGLFLPLILRADSFLDAGLISLAIVTYTIYTALVLVDAVLGIYIFGRR